MAISNTQKKDVYSFLKWVGGKRKLLEQYKPLLPSTLVNRRYVEPFMGSGAVFFHVVQNLNPLSCTLLDINPELVNAFLQLQEGVEAVIAALTAHRDCHNRAGITEDDRKVYYYGVRALDPDLMSPAARAARFIYLNKTCFNGLHRLNSKGKFNVPMGKYSLPAIFDADHLREVSVLLQNVTIKVCAFQECGKYVGANDFVYLDPPYEPLSATSSFTGYSKDRFTSDHQRELRDVVQHLSLRADCMLSNSTAPLIEALYNGETFKKHYVMAGRAINSSACGRGKIEELVITTYP